MTLDPPGSRQQDGMRGTKDSLAKIKNERKQEYTEGISDHRADLIPVKKNREKKKDGRGRPSDSTASLRESQPG